MIQNAFQEKLTSEINSVKISLIETPFFCLFVCCCWLVLSPARKKVFGKCTRELHHQFQFGTGLCFVDWTRNHNF
jgi:hypothetical protein